MRTTRFRYREPYNGRLTYISGCLVVGHNMLHVAKEDGQSSRRVMPPKAPGVGPAKLAKVQAKRRFGRCQRLAERTGLESKDTAEESVTC